MINIAKAVKVIGLKGEIKVYPYSPESSIRVGLTIYIDSKKYTITSMRYQKKLPVIKLLGIDTIEQAEPFINKELFINREDIVLDDGEYLITDLIGFDIYDNQTHIGVLKDIWTEYAHDIYVVDAGEEKYIPAVKEFVKEIDLANKRIIVNLIEGLWW